MIRVHFETYFCWPATEENDNNDNNDNINGNNNNIETNEINTTELSMVFIQGLQGQHRVSNWQEPHLSSSSS